MSEDIFYHSESSEESLKRGEMISWHEFIQSISDFLWIACFASVFFGTMVILITPHFWLSIRLYAAGIFFFMAYLKTQSYANKLHKDLWS